MDDKFPQDYSLQTNEQGSEREQAQEDPSAEIESFLGKQRMLTSPERRITIVAHLLPSRIGYSSRTKGAEAYRLKMTLEE